jgi:hypothetical protein
MTKTTWLSVLHNDSYLSLGKDIGIGWGERPRA